MTTGADKMTNALVNAVAYLRRTGPAPMGVSDRVIATLCEAALQDGNKMREKLIELYEWLDDIGDGAPDSSPTAIRALNYAAEIKELIQ